MPTWNSRGLRGSTLEELINRTNERYGELGLALIQKIPTPITPINIDKETRHITLAYFDAKECAQETFALENIHPHQVSFMENFEKQDGVAFFLIYYTGLNEFYYLPYRNLKVFWDRAQNGGRKSFRHDELDMRYALVQSHEAGIFVPYLDALAADLDSREEKD